MLFRSKVKPCGIRRCSIGSSLNCVTDKAPVRSMGVRIDIKTYSCWRRTLRLTDRVIGLCIRGYISLDYYQSRKPRLSQHKYGTVRFRQGLESQ